MNSVDSNVPMYLVGAAHPHKVDAQRWLERLVADREPLVTGAEVLQETLQRYRAIDRSDAIQPAFVPVVDLTSREVEVLALMAEGRSNAAIADALMVTHGAVEKHISNILGKLRVPPSESDHRRALAVLAYLRDR